MFDVGFSEVLLIAVVALVAIGPEDLPGMLFRLGRMTRQVRLFMNNIRNQYADIMHEAEVNHYRKTLGVDLTDDNEAAVVKSEQPVTLPKPQIIEPEVVFDDEPQPKKDPNNNEGVA